MIGGSYDGIMQAGSIWATETAQIAGEIHYQSLQMDRGAALNCRVVHNWQEPLVAEEAADDEAEAEAEEAPAEE